MAFGFSDLGSMKGADILIVHRDDAGTGWAVTDTHATGFFKPVRDDSQDARLVSMEYDAAAGAWAAVVARKVKTCDLSDDFVVSARANFIVWAHGPASGPGFEGVAYHGTQTRGYIPRAILNGKKRAARTAGSAAAGAGAEAAAELPSPAVQQPTEYQLESTVSALQQQLRYSEASGAKCMGGACGSEQGATPSTGVPGPSMRSALPPVVVNADGSMTMDILCSSDIPEDETTYMTCYVEMPSDQPYHITSYTTIYGHRLVHHSLVYACGKEKAEPIVEQLLNTTGPGPYNRKAHLQLCESFYMNGPFPSSPTYAFPPAIGLPIGAGSYKYLAIEVHYNNPSHEAGQRDPGTGLRLAFEPKSPKKKDVGILTVAQFLLDISPGQASAPAKASVCHSNCTRMFSQDVTMIAQGVHMHGLGKSVVTRRVRNGVELEPLAWVRGFDYNYQTWISMPSPSVVLKRGDELSMVCEFDSRGRERATHYGPATNDEMCFWWIYYYPAQPKQSICSSLGDTELHLCMESLDELRPVVSAAIAGDKPKLQAAVLDLVIRNKAILGKPQPVTKAFNRSAGCGAQAP